VNKDYQFHYSPAAVPGMTFKCHSRSLPIDTVQQIEHKFR